MWILIQGSLPIRAIRTPRTITTIRTTRTTGATGRIIMMWAFCRAGGLGKVVDRGTVQRRMVAII